MTFGEAGLVAVLALPPSVLVETVRAQREDRP
jgi:hypothetical protein